MLPLQSHREFQVVTPRTLQGFTGNVLVLPRVSQLSDAERAGLKKFSAAGGQLVINGANAATEIAGAKVMQFSEDPAAAYFNSLEKNFVEGTVHMPEAYLKALGPKEEIVITAPPNCGSKSRGSYGSTAHFSGKLYGACSQPDRRANSPADNSGHRSGKIW